MPLLTALLFAGLLFGSCRHEAARTDAPAAARALPDIAGFVAGEEAKSGSFVRRSYARDGERTTVTLARFSMGAAGYDEWVRMSTTDFPQASLDIGSARGNGFYQCAADDASRCNLLIQLRCGIHIEIRGESLAKRADADAIARGLDLRRMDDACPTPAITDGT
jgi:hypothetical protein